MLDPSKIVNTTLPLGPRDFKRLIEDKETVFSIAFSKSLLKTHKANIAFLANANVPAIIDFDDEGLTPEYLAEFITEWMSNINILDISPITNIVAKILLSTLNIKNDIAIPKMITDEFITEFIKNNSDLIARWVEFLDSVFLVYMEVFRGKSSEETENYQYDGELGVIEDRDYVGKNIVLLFSVEGFSEYYYTSLKEVTNDPYYYKHQFEDYMFKGQRLAAYFNHPNNTIPYISAATELIIKEIEEGKVQ